MSRIFNFSAGPSVLPESVLEQAKHDMLDYRGQGMSVMEMSHRSATFEAIIDSAERRLRDLLKIPDTYRVLFMQGGATAQFSAVPLNLFGLPSGKKALFVNSGSWSKKAIAEANRYGEAVVVADSADRQFRTLPVLFDDLFQQPASYAHLTTNNTIFGTTFYQMPDTGSLPLVADMSSNFLSEPLNVASFGLVYAGAQKNAGPAGVTIVIIREDLIGHALPETPVSLDYAVAAKAKSLYNTPPTYAIYIADLVFEWLESLGGLPEIGRRNREKAQLLYTYLDESSFFRAAVKEPAQRSLMNVPFLLADEAQNAAFLKGAQDRGLANLKGHRSVGGMRASLYNAMPKEGVEALVSFMREFEQNL